MIMCLTSDVKGPNSKMAPALLHMCWTLSSLSRLENIQYIELFFFPYGHGGLFM